MSNLITERVGNIQLTYQKGAINATQKSKIIEKITEIQEKRAEISRQNAVKKVRGVDK